MLDGVGTSANNAASAVNNLASAMSNLNGGSVSVPSIGTAQGFASGSPSIPKDMNAWKQEEGPEIIVSPSRKAIYTPLKEGDSVLTAEMTKNLWDWSKMKPNLALVNQGMPSALTPMSTTNINNNDTSSMVININCPNVTDNSGVEYLQKELRNFASQLRVAKYQYFNPRK